MVTIAILLVFFTGIGLANSADIEYTTYYTSDKALSYLSELENESIINFTNPDSSIYNQNVIKVYGQIPNIENASQLAEYIKTLRKVRDDSYDEISTSLYPEGPIVLYGYNTISGYFAIDLYNYDGQASYSEEEIDNIYNVVKNQANENGIDNIPVVFYLTNNTGATGYYDIDLAFLEETTTKNENTNISVPKKNDVDKFIPGFGSLSCLLMLLIASYRRSRL